ELAAHLQREEGVNRLMPVFADSGAAAEATLQLVQLIDERDGQLPRQAQVARKEGLFKVLGLGGPRLPQLIVQLSQSGHVASSYAVAPGRREQPSRLGAPRDRCPHRLYST